MRTVGDSVTAFLTKLAMSRGYPRCQRRTAAAKRLSGVGTLAELNFCRFRSLPWFLVGDQNCQGLILRSRSAITYYIEWYHMCLGNAYAL